MIIDIAKEDDIPDITRMVKNFHSEYPFKLDFDDNKIADLIHQLVTASIKDKVLIVAREDEGNVIGLIAAIATEVLFSSTRVAAELMWWVDPEHRHTQTGMALLEAFEMWAEQVGCKVIQMSSVESPITDRLTKVYGRRGYKLIERNYLKGIAV